MLLAPFRMLLNFVACILVGLGTLGLGMMKTVFWTVVTMVGHTVAVATNIRIFSKTEEKNISQSRGTGFVIGSIALGLAAFFVLLETMLGLFGSESSQAEFSKMWAKASANVPYLGYILLVMLGTNTVSLLYEVGRMNNGRIFNAETDEESEDLDIGEAEKILAEVPDLENYLDGMDKIEEIEEMTRELAEEWFKKIEEMLKRGVIDPNEANNLTVAVENRLSAVEKSRV